MPLFLFEIHLDAQIYSKKFTLRRALVFLIISSAVGNTAEGKTPIVRSEKDVPPSKSLNALVSST